MKDKLKKIVEKMMEGGLCPRDLFPVYKESNEVDFSFDSFDLGKHVDGRTAILFTLKCQSQGKVWYQSQDRYSPQELFTNPAAMGALFGRDDMCTRPKEGGCCHGDPGTANCSLCSLNQDAYVYHGLKAAELLLTQGQQQSIEYIWKECGE